MLVQLFIIYYVVFSYIDVPYFNIVSGVTSDRFVPALWRWRSIRAATSPKSYAAA